MRGKFRISSSSIALMLVASCGSKQRITGTSTAAKTAIPKSVAGAIEKNAADNRAVSGTGADGAGPDNLPVMPNSAKPGAQPFIRILGESEAVGLRPRSLGVYVLSGMELVETLKVLFGSMPRPTLGKSGNPGAMTVFFTPEEAQKIGTYAIVPQERTLKANQQRVTQADSDYLGALRSFFGEACPILVAREMDAKSEMNVFVAGLGTPTPARVSGAMTTFFGFSAPSGQLHDGAAEYSALMAKHLSAVPESSKSAALKDEYVLLCVQLGSDPRFHAR